MKFASKSFLTVFIGLLLISFVSFAEQNTIPGTAITQPDPPVESTTPHLQSGTRLWNLQDADILSVINEVSQETGKNFAVDPRVQGKITLVSSKPLRRSEVYQVFVSVLSMLGYSAVPSGKLIKIIPNMESSEQATPVLTKQSQGRIDDVVVRVIPLSNVSANQLIPVLRPLLPQWSNVSAYMPGNVIILVGRAANLDRIYTIIQDVDKAANSAIQLIPLHHAQASQVAKALTNLQNAARSSGETPLVSIAVDERSNSILLSGPKYSRLRMRVLISQLDLPESTIGNTEVVYLRYLQAKTFAPLLGKIAQNIAGKESGGNTDAASSNLASDTTTSAATTTNGNGSGNNTSTAIKDVKEPSIHSNYIQAEVSTNAIIITAPPALMRAIKSVIAKLDIRPAQVLVEAIIAEVDESNFTSLGIQWGSVTPNGAIIPNNGNVTDFPPLGAGIFGIMPSVQIRTVLTMLQNQNGVDILSTPEVVVLDNQAASIEIGQRVSVQTGSYATTSGAVTSPTPFTTNAYQDVTLKLDVTPQINLGKSVRLKLHLKNDSLQNPINPGATPLINTSSISNSVIINSDDVLVLGGLISHVNNENANKVPIISSIPIIGYLFQQKVSNQQKKNLLVFLKPVIMHNADDSATITHMKYAEMKSLQANYTEDLANIGSERMINTLPPWKNTKDLPAPFEK